MSVRQRRSRRVRGLSEVDVPSDSKVIMAGPRIHCAGGWSYLTALCGAQSECSESLLECLLAKTASVKMSYRKVDPLRKVR